MAPIGSSVANHAAKLAAAERGFNAVFYSALEETRAQWETRINLLAMRATSNNSEENHRWLGPPPGMSEWKGERKLGKLRAEGFTIVNKDWANGLEISGIDIRRDKLGQYNARIADLAESGWRHKWELLRDLLNGGFSGLGYDGVAFFHDAHPRYGTITNDNLTTDQLDTDAFKAAVTRLKAIQDEEGRYLNLSPTHLIVGTDLEWAARDILEREFDTAGATNTARGAAQLIVMPGITEKYWFVADLSRPIKPLILQTEVEIKPDQMIAPDSPNVFLTNTYYYGASWAGNAGYGLWELVQGSTGAGS